MGGGKWFFSLDLSQQSPSNGGGTQTLLHSILLENKMLRDQNRQSRHRCRTKFWWVNKLGNKVRPDQSRTHFSISLGCNAFLQRDNQSDQRPYVYTSWYISVSNDGGQMIKSSWQTLESFILKTCFVNLIKH